MSVLFSKILKQFHQKFARALEMIWCEYFYDFVNELNFNREMLFRNNTYLWHHLAHLPPKTYKSVFIRNIDLSHPWLQTWLIFSSAQNECFSKSVMCHLSRHHTTFFIFRAGIYRKTWPPKSKNTQTNLRQSHIVAKNNKMDKRFHMFFLLVSFEAPQQYLLSWRSLHNCRTHPHVRSMNLRIWTWLWWMLLNVEFCLLITSHDQVMPRWQLKRNVDL